jgi:mannose-6-phosphate isomerase-like protein (cupin superfamily)
MRLRSIGFTTRLFLQTALVLAATPIWRSGPSSELSAAQAANATTATYVTTAEIDAALRQMPPTSTTYDKPIKTVDTGAYKVTIVVLRRVPGKTPDSALLHDRVTEVYQILTGAGMFETGGQLMDGKPVDLTSEAAGPSVRGTIQGGESRRMGPGDVVVIPPGLPHRFSKLEGTITYMVTRIEAPRP